MSDRPMIPAPVTDNRNSFRIYFLTGLITILPLWLTLYIVWLAFKWISGVTSPFLIPVFRMVFGPPWGTLLARIASFFLTLFTIWFVGKLTTHIVGRRFLVWGEAWVLRVPILRELYLSLRKFFDYLFTQKKAFRSVVLIPYPSRGIYCIGFVTMEGVGEVQEKTSERVFNIFVPSTPNPTTGFLVFIPEKDIIPLDMSVDDAFKLIISGGIISPETRQTPETTA